MKEKCQRRLSRDIAKELAKVKIRRREGKTYARLKRNSQERGSGDRYFPEEPASASYDSERG
jgi:arginine repressor